MSVTFIDPICSGTPDLTMTIWPSGKFNPLPILAVDSAPISFAPVFIATMGESMA